MRMIALPMVVVRATLLLLLFGCTYLPETKTFPFPSTSISVSDDVIYCDGKPFAELKKYRDRGFRAEDQRAAGLVIRYLNNNKEVWIHPKEGISIEKDGVRLTKIDELHRLWKGITPDQYWWIEIYIGSRPMRKEDAIRSVVYDIRISPDGKYVLYESQGMIFDSYHRFSVEEGQ